MLIHGNLHTLWLLLLVLVSGSDAMRIDLSNWREGDVRLSGARSASEGRVEVYHNGQWGTACGDGWDMAEAQVVCRQLRFPGARSVSVGRDYGQASRLLGLHDVTCKGTENHLSSCEFNDWRVTDCSHKGGVGVICNSVKPGPDVTNHESAHSLDHTSSLSDDLGRLFDSGEGCDFKIAIQSDPGNKQEDLIVCAHKTILLQYPLFTASPGMTNITVILDQSCQPHFSSFIRYLYTRKIDVTFSSAKCLHSMASKFGVKQLMEDAGHLFTEILPEDGLFHTQTSLYNYAVETGDLVLQENCMQYLAWNYQNLTMSPAWPLLSVQVLGTLLARSDLVVPNEYVLLQTVESWILEKGDSISLESQADLLSRVRFPMIPAEMVYGLEVNSSLYSAHKDMYRNNMLKAFQFNVLLLSNLQANQNFNKDVDDYQPRIYTSEPWSTVVPPSTMAEPVRVSSSHYYQRQRGFPNYYPSSQNTMFNTPVHSSMIFRDKTIRWEAKVFTNQQECSNQGLRCQSLPAARLLTSGHVSQRNVVFHNRLLLMCQDKYVCQVQDFKVNMAYTRANGTQALAYPCPGDKFSYRFVVRPVYV